MLKHPAADESRSLDELERLGKIPEMPIGTKKSRRYKAIHWDLATDMSRAEMATRMGVSERTVYNYLNSEEALEVDEVIEQKRQEWLLAGAQELEFQLKQAGSRSRDPEKPVKVWREDGELHVKDKVHPETGEITGKYPVPEDMEMGPDEKARYFGRKEFREILQMMAEMFGFGSPEEIRLSGQVDHKHDHGIDEDTQELISEMEWNV